MPSIDQYEPGKFAVQNKAGQWVDFGADQGRAERYLNDEMGLSNAATATADKNPAATTDSSLAAILAGLNLGKSFNQAGGIGQLDPYNAALQQEYLRQRLTQLEIPMSQAEQANLIAKMTGYWPGAGNAAMSEPQALDAIAKSRDDKFWNFYRANGWKTDTPEQKQTIVQNWIKSGDPRWKGKNSVQVAQELGLGGTAGQGQKTFEREQWEKSEEGRKFSQDLASKQFSSAEQAKAFGQALAQKQFGSSEQAKQFGQDMAERQFAAQQQSSAAQRRERMAELTGLYYPDEPGYAEPTGGQQWNQREPAYAEPTQGGFQRDINIFPRGQEPMPAGPRPTGFTVDTPAQSNQLAVTFDRGRGLQSDAVMDTLARLGVRATQNGENGATLELPAGREAEVTEAIRRAGIFGSVGGGENPQFAAPTGDNPLLPGTQGGYWPEGAGAAPAAPKSNVWGLPQDFQWADYQRGLDDWAFRYQKEHGEWPSDNDWQRRIQGTMEEQGIDAPAGFREQLLNTMLENNKARGTMFPGTLEVDRTPEGQPRQNPGPGGVPWTMRAYDTWAQKQPGYAAPQASTGGAFPYPTDAAISSPSQPSGPEPDWRNVPAVPEPQWRGNAMPADGVAYTGGSADFDERTGTYRSTGAQYPPSQAPAPATRYALQQWNAPSQPIETLEAKRLREAIAAREAADARAAAGLTGRLGTQDTLEARRMAMEQAERERQYGLSQGALTGSYNGQDTLAKQQMAQQGKQFYAQLLGGLSGPRDWVKYQAAQPQSAFGAVKAGPSYEGAFADFWNGGGRTDGMPAQASDSAGNAIPAEVLQPGKLKPQDLNAFEASPTKRAMQEGLWSAQGLDPNDMWARARAVQPTGKANPNTWWR